MKGGRLKESGTTHWEAPNTDAINDCKFTALPGGSRGNDGAFGYIRYDGYYWSATEVNPTLAWIRHLTNVSSEELEGYVSKKQGLSVRCIKE